MSDTVSSFDAARRLCDRAEALIDAGRPAEALPLLAQAIAADPGNTRAYCLQSLALMKREQYSAALRSAETATRLEPTEEWGHRLRAIMLLEMGRKREALAPAREAARIAPFETSVLHTLARCQLGAGKRREARATAEELRSVAPEWGPAHELLGLIALQERGARAAEAHYREALRLNPGSWTAMNNLGLALQRQGRRKEAIECFHQAARLNPSKELVRKNLSGAVRNYVGMGSVGLIWVVFQLIRALISASESGRSSSTLPAWGGVLILAAVALLILLGYLVRKRRMAELHPEVSHFYRDQSVREGRRALVEVPLLLIAVLGGLASFALTLAWFTNGQDYDFGIEGVVLYGVICGVTLTAIGALAWLSWRRKRPR